LGLAAVLCVATEAAAACPIGTTVSVDNDTPGSGYSEDKPQNWLSNNVSACQGTYRYLSHTVGDGTRKDKATWKPKIAEAGYYEVTTSFRATENRTTDADYVLYDDKGGSTKKVINQQQGSGCTKVVVGTAYCAPGGNCRLVLDGTDDGQSDSTDVTTFKLVSCDGSGDAGTGTNPCAAISQNPSYELCDSSPTTCAGVFTDGSGCTQFCAAAGMTCVARFGGEPGCQKEANTPIPCGADNGHGSDYCECVGSASPDAGTGGGAQGGAGGAAGQGTGAAGGADAGIGLGGAGATLATGGSAGAASTPRGETTTEDGGCGCHVGKRGGSHGWIALALAGFFWLRRRS
jgi:MYXO-CTERM domain-containing protein